MTKSKIKVRRLPVTLLEIIIVMAILATVSGVVVISINKALVDQRFRTEVGLIIDELRLAQNLMLILDTDVHVHFAVSEKEQGIKYWLQLETSLPKNIQKEVLRKRKVLKTVKGVFLADELLTAVKEKHIDVKFLSNGSVMSKGIMRLASSDSESPPKGTLQRFVCLAGYPKPILSSDTKEEAEKLCKSLEENLDDRLTDDTMRRLPERLQKKESLEEKEVVPKEQQDNTSSGEEQKPFNKRQTPKRGAKSP
jgi:hypothetical protein